MIKINSPNNCINERKYIYEYIFENQFNLKTSVEYGDYRCVEIINTLNNTTLPNVGRGVDQRPSGTGFTPGTGGNFGIGGIGLAN